MPEQMKHIYSLPMEAHELAMVDTLLELTASIMNDDVMSIKQNKDTLIKLASDIGAADFKVFRGKVDLLTEQADENGELQKVTYGDPFINMLKSIGFKIEHIDANSLLETPCCGHPKEGSETDPVCEHCNLRHP